jgi:hypothetical protein
MIVWPKQEQKGAMPQRDEYRNQYESAEVFGLSSRAFGEVTRRMGIEPTRRNEPGRTLYYSLDQLREISRRTGMLMNESILRNRREPVSA